MGANILEHQRATMFNIIILRCEYTRFFTKIIILICKFVMKMRDRTVKMNPCRSFMVEMTSFGKFIY